MNRQVDRQKFEYSQTLTNVNVSFSYRVPSAPIISTFHSTMKTGAGEAPRMAEAKNPESAVPNPEAVPAAPLGGDCVGSIGDAVSSFILGRGLVDKSSNSFFKLINK